MVMSFTINYCDIELEEYWQIPVNKLLKCAQGMLGVSDMITKLTLPILLINNNTGQLVPMSTRTHVNSYPCQLVPISARTHVN